MKNALSELKDGMNATGSLMADLVAEQARNIAGIDAKVWVHNCSKNCTLLSDYFTENGKKAPVKKDQSVVVSVYNPSTQQRNFTVIEGLNDGHFEVWYFNNTDF